MQTRIYFCEDNIPLYAFLLYRQKFAMVFKTGSRVLFIMTFHECRGGRKNRSVWSPHVPKRRSGIIVFLAVKHDTEPPKTSSSAPHDWHRRMALNRARREEDGGWRGELKFSIASTAPPILHSPVLTGTWQQDCSLSARVNALALCKPSIGKIDGHLIVTPPASGGAWRSMEKDSRAISYDKSIVPSATVRI